MVMSCTTPVLLCTTKYYSNTNYSVLQILLCATKYYSSTTLYYKVLLEYYPVLLKYYKVLLQVLPCTTKYYSSTNLYYKVLLCTTKYFMIDPHHIWNVIYNAGSNKKQSPTSANTAPATQNESHDWSA